MAPPSASPDASNQPPLDPTHPTPVPPLKPADDDSGDFVVAPLPGYNPSQEFNLTLVSQYIYHPEGHGPTTPPSILAAAGFYSEMDSWAGLIAYKGSSAYDDWRYAVAGGYARIKYDFYGTGQIAGEAGRSIPIAQEMPFGFGQLLRRIVPHFYGGARVLGSKVDISTGASLPPEIENEAKLSMAGFGPVFQWDTRDNEFFPTKGEYSNLNFVYFLGDSDYWSCEVDFNKYVSIEKTNGVLAMRGYGRFTGGDVPFYGMSQFGQRSDLRGYISGQYRDKMMFDIQAEYRQPLGGRWTVVAFAGFGEVAPDMDKFYFSNMLWSVGTGVRFRLSEKNPVNLRLDWAYGKEGSAWYLSMGEAF
ncbi:MAG: BamA/TamA family outer membrane protein [Puniceicoccales bacterium]|nr:BamA/TamA family outer membrane protein [Puniceicoccales bacterium]